MIASGDETLAVPLGSRVSRPVTFSAPTSGSRVYLVLTTTKSGRTVFTDFVESLGLGTGSSNVDDASSAVSYTGSWGHARHR